MHTIYLALLPGFFGPSVQNLYGSIIDFCPVFYLSVLLGVESSGARVFRSTRICSLPIFGWLYRFIPVSNNLYMISIGVGVLAAILTLFRAWSKAAMIVLAVALTYVVMVPNFYGKLWHTQIIIWHVWILVFVPRELLDGSWKAIRLSKVKRPEYGFYIRILWLLFGHIYFAGFYKLWTCGLEWAIGDNFVPSSKWSGLSIMTVYPGLELTVYPGCFMWEESLLFFLS